MTHQKKVGPALVDFQLRDLIGQGCINGISPDDVQPASIDLRAKKIWATSYRPNPEEFDPAAFIQDAALEPAFTDAQIEKGITLTLGRAHSYLVLLDGTLNLPAGISGGASPKSSIGRIGADCAVLVGTGGREFNSIPIGYRGPLYLVMAPQTFPLDLRSGVALAQLRLFEGNRDFLAPRDLALMCNNYNVVHRDDDVEPTINEEGVLCHVDLSGPMPNLVAARRGKKLPLWGEGEADPTEYFAIKSLDHGDTLILEPGQFALVRTIERLRVTEFLCAEMVAHREEQGHVTTHRAGYGDPGFGYGRGEHTGNRFICELRNFGVDAVAIKQGSPICVIRYMYTQYAAQNPYSVLRQSHYQEQEEQIKIAKFFAPWPVAA
ncbi:MAG: 2'-deoxycytidine 5'-triphosphate deaminase [bacterium]